MKPLRPRGSLYSLVLSSATLLIAALSTHAQEEPATSPPSAFPPPPPPALRVVYFVPSDTTPHRGAERRLERVMTELRLFFREGMEDQGYGPRTFDLEQDEFGKMILHIVRGEHPSARYNKKNPQSFYRVLDEVRRAFSEVGLDTDRETILVFTPLLIRNPDGSATEFGPFGGIGNQRSGFAVVYDDTWLDSRLLGSAAPGGYFQQPCPLGKFNSVYIGGAAHELGHALGLPHVSQTKADAARGTALMGMGNLTFGEELRREGPGSFLSAASAALLAGNRIIVGDIKGAERAPVVAMENLKVAYEDQSLVLTGRLNADPPAMELIAYNDIKAIEGDYDAVGWTTLVDGSGNFRLVVGDTRPGEWQLRLTSTQENGALHRMFFDYQIPQSGAPDLPAFTASAILQNAHVAFREGRSEQALAMATKLNQDATANAITRHKARLLTRLASPPSRIAPDAVPTETREVDLSDLEFAAHTVGWGTPLRDQVVIAHGGQCFIQLNGEFYDRGLFAHAPSVATLKLNGAWKKLRSSYGVQDSHPGAVRFVVRGDGKELFRSEVISDHRLRELDLKLEGVNLLELIVEPAADGADGDWAVWVSPKLLR